MGSIPGQGTKVPQATQQSINQSIKTISKRSSKKIKTVHKFQITMEKKIFEGKMYESKRMQKVNKRKKICGERTFTKR